MQCDKCGGLIETGKLEWDELKWRDRIVFFMWVFCRWLQELLCWALLTGAIVILVASFVDTSGFPDWFTRNRGWRQEDFFLSLVSITALTIGTVRAVLKTVGIIKDSKRRRSLRLRP
jgi:hypothetical protein